MDELAKEERDVINGLVGSLISKLPFTAPEMLAEKVTMYIETAWLRGRSAGIAETRRMLGTAEPNGVAQEGDPK